MKTLLLALLLQLSAPDGTYVAAPRPLPPLPTPRDSAQLADAARSKGVPVLVMLAAAVAESGIYGGNEALGPGRTGPGGERLCREIGRMQVSPCDHWETMFASCGVLGYYDTNITCGAAVLAHKHDICVIRGDPSWSCAIRTYNGTGRDAAKHLARVERILGQIVLRIS